MFDQMLAFVVEHWYLLPLFVIMALAVYVLLRLQVMLQNQMAHTIETLLRDNPELCLERLNHNGRLKWLFRKPVLALWRLDCHLAQGNDEQTKDALSQLRSMKLEPQDKLELFQRELSYYALSGNAELALQARADLKKFLKEAGANQDKKYAAIMDEADIIIGVYVEHNTGLIKKLIGRAEHTKNDVMRGIIQFRIAKLCWFNQDTDMMNTYLARAEKNLKNTWYAPVIAKAKVDPGILEFK